MPTLKELINEDKQALDWLANTPDSPMRKQVMESMNIDDEDVKAHQWALNNPDDPEANTVKNIVYEKLIQDMPVVQQQGVSGVERFNIQNLLSDQDAQLAYLKTKGYDTKIKDGQIAVRKPGIDTFWSVVDPKELELGDVIDVIGDAIEIGAGTIGTLAAPFIGGAAVSGGFEAGKQLLGKAIGIREEFAPTEIASKAIVGGVMGKAGQYLGKAVSGVKGYLSEKVIDTAKPKAALGEIENIAKEWGVELLPSQRYDSKTISGLTENLVKKGSGKLSDISRKFQDALADSAENVVKKAAQGKIPEGKGEDFANAIFKEMKKPADELYDLTVNAYAKEPVPGGFMDDMIESIKQRHSGFENTAEMKSIEGLGKATNIASLNQKINDISESLAPKFTANMKYNEIQILRDGLQASRAKLDDLLVSKDPTLAGVMTRARDIYRTAAKERERLEEVGELVAKSIRGLTVKESETGAKALGRVDPAAFYRNVSKLEPSKRAELFGNEDNIRKLGLMLSSLDKPNFPSGTTAGLALEEWTPTQIGKTISQRALLSYATWLAKNPGKMRVAEGVGAATGIGAGILGTQMIKDKLNKENK